MIRDRTVKFLFLLHWAFKVLAGQMHPFLTAAVQDYKDYYREISERDQWLICESMNELQLLKPNKKRSDSMICSSCAHWEKKLWLQCILNCKPGNLFWNKRPMRNSQVSRTNGPSTSAFCLLWWQRMCCLKRVCKFGLSLASHSPCTFLVFRTVALVKLDGVSMNMFH